MARAPDQRRDSVRIRGREFVTCYFHSGHSEAARVLMLSQRGATLASPEPATEGRMIRARRGSRPA